VLDDGHSCQVLTADAVKSNVVVFVTSLIANELHDHAKEAAKTAEDHNTPLPDEQVDIGSDSETREDAGNGCDSKNDKVDVFGNLVTNLGPVRSVKFASCLVNRVASLEGQVLVVFHITEKVKGGVGGHADGDHEVGDVAHEWVEGGEFHELGSLHPHLGGSHVPENLIHHLLFHLLLHLVLVVTTLDVNLFVITASSVFRVDCAIIDWGEVGGFLYGLFDGAGGVFGEDVTVFRHCRLDKLLLFY